MRLDHDPADTPEAREARIRRWIGHYENIGLTPRAPVGEDPIYDAIRREAPAFGLTFDEAFNPERSQAIARTRHRMIARLADLGFKPTSIARGLRMDRGTITKVLQKVRREVAA